MVELGRRYPDSRFNGRYVFGMDLEEVLGVLHDWLGLGLEIEISVHGANRPVGGALSCTAICGGEMNSTRIQTSMSPSLVLDDGDGTKIGSFSLPARVFRGGGWFDVGKKSPKYGAASSGYFGRRLLWEVGAPVGRISTLTEVSLEVMDGKTLRPDGAITVERGRDGDVSTQGRGKHRPGRLD